MSALSDAIANCKIGNGFPSPSELDRRGYEIWVAMGRDSPIRNWWEVQGVILPERGRGWDE